MAIRTVLHYPDPRLRERSKPVVEVNQEIKTLVEDMAETMYAAPGVGLAAPQIGVHLRIFVIDIADDHQPSDLKVFINPEPLTSEGKVTWEEGCLSFPSVVEAVERANKIRVRALDANGKTFELAAEGLLAVAIQHELDHLNGILMIDHMGMLRKRMIDRKMRRREPTRARA